MNRGKDAAESEQQFALEVMDGPMDGCTLVGDLATVRIGRRPDSDLPLHGDRSVSQRHAQLNRAAGGWVLEDLRSTNGTWVDGTKLTTAVTIREGDEFLVGNAVVRLAAAAGRESFLPTTEDLRQASSEFPAALAEDAARGWAVAVGCAAEERRPFVTDRHLFFGLAAMNGDLAVFAPSGGPIGQGFLGRTLRQNEFWSGGKAWIERHLRAVRWDEEIAFAGDVLLTPRVVLAVSLAQQDTAAGPISAAALLRALLAVSPRLKTLLARDGIDAQAAGETLETSAARPKSAAAPERPGRSGTSGTTAAMLGATAAAGEFWRAVLAGRKGTPPEAISGPDLEALAVFREVVAFAGTVERFVVAMVNSLSPDGEATKVFLLPGWRTSLGKLLDDLSAGRPVEVEELRSYLQAVEGWLLAAATSYQEAPAEWFRGLWSKLSPGAIEAALSEGGRKKVYRIEAVELWEQYKRLAEVVDPKKVGAELMAIVRRRSEERFARAQKASSSGRSRSRDDSSR